MIKLLLYSVDRKMATFQHFYELTTATFLPNFVVITNINSKPKLKPFEKKSWKSLFPRGDPWEFYKKSLRQRIETKSTVILALQFESNAKNRDKISIDIFQMLVNKFCTNITYSISSSKWAVLFHFNRELKYPECSLVRGQN